MATETKIKNNKGNGKTKKKRRTNSGEADDIVSKKERWLWCISGSLVLLALLLLLSQISNFFTGVEDQRWHAWGDPTENWLGSLGVWLVRNVVDRTFGLSTFLLPILMIAIALRILRIGHIRLWKWLINCVLIMVWLSVTGAWLQMVVFEDSYIQIGGMHGRTALLYMMDSFGKVGTFLFLFIAAVAYIGYLSGETINTIKRGIEAARRKAEKALLDGEECAEVPQQPTGKEEDNGNNAPETEPDISVDTSTTIIFDTDSKEDDEKAPANADDIPFEVEASTLPHPNGNSDDADGEPGIRVHIGEKEPEAELDETGALEPYDPKLDLSLYKYPTLDLLKKYEEDGIKVDMEEQNKNKSQIIQVLHNFGVEISSIKATVGPTITLYEITPAPGIRISKIRNLEDDIALSLSALGIRIIAPIPGKGTVGIEVPNAKPKIVSMESLVNSRKFQTTHFELPIALGKTITDEIYMADLAKMPHLLVAGATGQGKSVGLNAIITSLLYKKHPAELKLVMVDPKKVEFSVYNPIVNHFLAQVEGNEDTDEPIITDVNKVVQTLKSLCVEMDARYDLLKKAKVRIIKEYNEKFKARQLNPEHGHRFLPYIVVIIDEFGDLIMTAGKEIELPIARIAQLARAVGIHMIIATQRPTTNIITGTIKANFPARIAFKVSAMIDSRTILDRPGANQLVGKGDMLILSGSEPVRVQCAFVDTPEVEAIANYIACQQSYTSPFPLPPVPLEGEGESVVNDVDMNRLDPMFEEVAKLVVSTQQGSTSMIQRKFSIGFNRAGRLMDQLEKAGIVGPAQGAKPRQVLVMGDVELLQILNNLR